MHVRLDREVGAVEHRMEVGDRGARTRATALGQLIPADPFLLGAVEVGICGEAAGGGRVEEGL